jgi:hypothetical protein
MIKTREARTALVGVLVLSACQDLNVTNTNSAPIETAFSTPANVETAIGSAFKTWWAAIQGDDVRQTVTYRPAFALAGMSGELTSASNLGQFDDIALEPRSEYNNFDAGQWVNRLPYQQLYASIAMATDVLRVLDGGMKLGTVDATTPNGRNTPRGRIWAKFIQGLGHIYLGMYFDKALLVDEKGVDDPYSKDFRPYPEVLAFGIKQLDEAIALAQANITDNLRTPTGTTNWVNGYGYTNADVVKLANSFVARAMVYGARTPPERAAADWNKVIERLDKGITAAGFSYATGTKTGFIQQAEPNTKGTRSYYVRSAQLNTDGRVSNYLLGPADTTGRYQAWLTATQPNRRPFIVATPDRRIHAAGNSTVSGTVFTYVAQQAMSANKGVYLQSNYRSVKYGTVSDTGERGVNSTMTPREMTLLRAEALIRLNRAVEAVPLINETRTPAGLKAVTVDGPPKDASCVPRRNDGTCGDLMDALMYEKRIETFAVEATIPWADARGWGKLLKGSLLQLPVPGRELQTLGLPYYSFGGSLPGSAP